MAIVPFEEIQLIIKTNPGKDTITHGREVSEKLRLHLEGEGMDEAIEQCDHFANAEMYAVQKQYATSNVDMFARILQQEDMIFMARGGSSYFKLPDQQEQEMNIAIANIEYGMSLRKWVKTFGLPAYRSDPMGVIFMEREQAQIDGNGNYLPARAYPTYKSIFTIFDYVSTGRRLEWICFQLSIGEAKSYGVTDTSLDSKSDTGEDSIFYRFVDDKKDIIVKKTAKINDTSKETEVTVAMVTAITQLNPIANVWKRTPAFIISDLIDYKAPDCFHSPLYQCVELADNYLQDRSVRNLQKLFHGFAKAIEPLLSCGTCMGSKVVDGDDCPDCTPPGGEPTGYKLKTRVSDVARFPLEMLEAGKISGFKDLFSYATPDIESWNKQDSNLESTEELIEMVYWGTVRMQRPSPDAGGLNGQPITATESSSNQAPKIARLNATADWVESTENAIADFIGEYLFPGVFKKSAISLGRDYVLKTAEELMDAYQTLLKSGAPDFSKDEALSKYYQAKYQSNHLQMEKYLKMLRVEPFPHDAPATIEASSVIPFLDKLAKRYFGEWSDTVPDINWITLKAQALREELRKYVTDKKITEPAPPQPAHSFN